MLVRLKDKKLLVHFPVFSRFFSKKCRYKRVFYRKNQAITINNLNVKCYFYLAVPLFSQGAMMPYDD